MEQGSQQNEFITPFGESAGEMNVHVKHIAWQDPQGRILAIIASESGLSVTFLDEVVGIATDATLRPQDIPNLSKFIFECAAEFGEAWRHAADRK